MKLNMSIDVKVILSSMTAEELSGLSHSIYEENCRRAAMKSAAGARMTDGERALARDDKVAAIRKLRTRTGVGLRVAKQVVEQYLM